jgi:xanthine dehydrogenase YagS FAD-binding subunit
MRPFAYNRATGLADASRLGAQTGSGQTNASTQFLAGGTTLIDLMKLDVMRPDWVVDINALRGPYGSIELRPEVLRLGALATMSAVAQHAGVADSFPVLSESLKFAASPQLRNMATLGGNVLQRTRCPYYRDPSWTACNKREPGSGCSALNGANHNHAILGVDETCIAQYPGDFGVALVALDAQVELAGPQGARRVAFASLHNLVNRQPQVETSLKPGEIITGFFVAHEKWMRRSLYLKIRNRASYEFALSSAAVALDLDGDSVRNVRIGLGGVAYRPWRAREAESALLGRPLTEASADAAAVAALKGAVTHGHNDYKIELSRRTLVRALLQAKSMTV